MPRLDTLPAPYALRVRLALDAASWESRCISAHAAPWIAWNVREDIWFGPAELDRVRAVLDALDATEPGLEGPELLTRCARELERVRAMSPAELGQLPAVFVNHITASRLGRRFDLAPTSTWARGTASGEASQALPPGTRVQVNPRVGFRVIHSWLTFEVGGVPVPKAPDHAMCSLGLPWSPGFGTVIRVEIPFPALRAAGASFAIPTVFDGILDIPVVPDWRARPEREHVPAEPWGHARDLKDDGPGLPEVIADITQAGTMDAEYLGALTIDWSGRPFLAGAAPR